MKKLITILYCLLGTVPITIAQSYNMTTEQFFRNKYKLNVAYVGENSFPELFLSYRGVQNNFEGAPAYLATTLEKGFHDNMGLGIDFSSQNVGYSSDVRGSLAYSYKLELSESRLLRLGLGLGIHTRKLSFDKMSDYDAVSKVNADANGNLDVEANFGVVFVNDNLQLGIALPTISKAGLIAVGSSLDRPLFMSHVSYDFDDLKNLNFTPQIMFFQYSEYQEQFLAALNTNIYNTLNIVTMYNFSTNYMTLGTSLNIQDRLNCSFALSFGNNENIKKSMGGTVEIGLKYRIQLSDKPSNDIEEDKPYKTPKTDNKNDTKKDEKKDDKTKKNYKRRKM